MKNTRTIRTELPTDVWDRFALEADEAGVPMARLLRDLIVKRDSKRVSRNTGASPSTGKDSTS